MIIYLFKQPNRFTLEKFFTTKWAPRLRQQIRMVAYESFLHWRNAPSATYIFSDIERLSVTEQERAAAIVSQLREAFPDIKILNHPIRSMKRYELLRLLHAEGVNDFNVYRLSERRTPARFPVFIRDENDHRGPVSGLLESPAALRDAIENMVGDGISMDDKIIVEFVDVSDPDGVFHKHGDYYVNGQVISQHVLYTKDWLVKFADGKAMQQRQIDFEASLASNHPFQAQVAAVFQMANIDYGRIDYAVVNGKVQVFEINTNPQVFPTTVNEGPRKENRARFLNELEDAFLAHDDHGDPATTRLTGGGRIKKALSATARDGVYDLMRWTGNLENEGRVRDALKRLTE